MRVRRARLWRWRRNELRHRSQAVEGCVLLVLGTAGFIGAPPGGAVGPGRGAGRPEWDRGNV